MDYLTYFPIITSLFSPSHLHEHEKTHFMFMLYNKIKFEMNINNCELLKTI